MQVYVTPRAERNFDSIIDYINDIRGFQLSRKTRMLYRIRDNKIIILSFFDVRQDPKKKLG